MSVRACVRVHVGMGRSENKLRADSLLPPYVAWVIKRGDRYPPQLSHLINSPQTDLLISSILAMSLQVLHTSVVTLDIPIIYLIFLRPSYIK